MISSTGVSNPSQPKHTHSKRSIDPEQRCKHWCNTNSSSRSLFIKREINVKGQMEVSVRKALVWGKCRPLKIYRLQTRMEVDRFVSHHLSLYGRFCYINIELAPKNKCLRLICIYGSHLQLFCGGQKQLGPNQKHRISFLLHPVMK